MKILGIDISSRSTGLGLIEDDKLIEFTRIVPNNKMSSAQKLCLFSTELNNLIAKYKPDEIAIEDVVQVRSVKVAKILARFNGIAIVEAYRYLQRDPDLYEPSKWKKLIEGCTGSSKKCVIQLAICIKYSLLPQNRIDFYKNKIEEVMSGVKSDNDDSRDKLKVLKKELKKAKKSGADENSIKEQIKQLAKDNKKSFKKNKEKISEEFDKISLDIYTECGINEDIADGIGVAIAFQKLHKL